MLLQRVEKAWEIDRGADDDSGQQYGIPEDEACGSSHGSPGSFLVGRYLQQLDPLAIERGEGLERARQPAIHVEREGLGGAHQPG